MTMTPELKAELKAAFADSWMKPRCYLGRDIEGELMLADMDVEEDAYYVCLSADGYLDSTDWHGPFPTMAHGARYLIDTYGEEA